FVAAPAYRNLGRYSNFYDSGVYLESARMLAAGYAPYRAIFISQPPLWLELIRLSFALFGQSISAAQMFTVGTMVITALAVGTIVLSIGSWLGAAMACITILMSPLAFFWAREITGEMPSAAFAAGSLALATRYASGGARLWLIAGSLALAGAVLVKLFGIYALPSLLLIAAARWRSGGPLRPRVWHTAADSGMVIGIVFGTVLAMVLGYGAPDVWAQAVAFHLGSRADLNIVRNFSLIVTTVVGDPALAVALPLALCAALEPWIGWAALGWLALTLIGLLIQHPLFTHHVVSLVAPLSLSAGIGLGALWKLGRRLYAGDATARSDGYGRIAGVAVFGACIILVTMVCRGGLAGRATEQLIGAYWRPPAADLNVAAELARSSGQPTGQWTGLSINKDGFILTDAPGIAFSSGRAMPPWLVDSSLKRIDNHYLATAEVEREVERYQVKAVLLWTGRLQRLPGLVAWLDRTFPTRRRYGAKGVLYLRP
ncbi:MAG TPA: glycosyltransferase family 39 protein, partial [Candidatus Binataceae bacterium]|nr:glycosyltransferase family 39 protein [Candidatus Binataceae bacterium]